MGFLFLLFLTVLFTTGALFLTYQLENYKDGLERELEARVGINLDIGSVSISGIRSFRIDTLTVELPFENGPSIKMSVPDVLVQIDLAGLMQGKIALDTLTLDNAVIDVIRPLDAQWSAMLQGEYPPSEIPFHVKGKNGRIRVQNIVQETSAELGNIDFDIARLAGAKELTLLVKGDFANDAEKRLAIKANFDSLEEFNVRVTQSSLTPEDAQIFFPSESPLIISGEISPTLRIYGGPDNIIILNLRAPFSDTQIQDQPEFIDPVTGELAVFATYDTVARELELTTAKVESEKITGSIDGSVYFTGDYPLFDLQLLCTQLPVQDVLESVIHEQLDTYGTLDFALEPQQQLLITLQGTSDNPMIQSELRSSGGTMIFTPNDEAYPPIELTLGAITGVWDSLAEEASGSINIIDGTITHEQSNISASAISGTLILADNKITLNPINAIITENVFVGSFEYDIESEDATIALNGTIKGLEDTTFKDSIQNIKLAGALNLKTEIRKRGSEYFLDAQLEASQTQLDYMWWFAKPPGIGASGFIHGHFIPKESYRFEFDADLASSQLDAYIEGTYFESLEAFRLMSAGLSSNYLDISTVGACITLPYRLTGTTGGYGFVEFEGDPEDPTHFKQRFGAFIESADLLPIDENAKEPLHFENTSIEVTMDNGATRTGSITLAAKSIATPPFTSTWFVGIEPPEEYASKPRDWKYSVSGRNMTLPPWIGSDFSGQGYSTETSIGFNNFSLAIDGGTLDGSYHAVRAENSYKTTVNWNAIPVHYFLEHLNYDDIMTGTTTGNIQYGLDMDDPGTLTGSGKFDVRDGQFSADFLYTLVGGQDGEGLASLPPRLEFSSLSSSVTLDSDIILTPDLHLESEGLKLDGKGQYIRDGDMDYVINVRLSPEMAESIPSMKESLNLQGYKVSGQDIVLSFNIMGPTFSPHGELAELPPASVTLVTGAGELLREGFNVIDTPRRMLVGIFKTIGGAVGAGASN